MIGHLWALLASSSGHALFASDCQPGYFDPDGSGCQIAPLGYYVPSAGATAALAAPPGSYVPTFGATAATLAPAGSFTSEYGQSTVTLAPPGRYVPTKGATAALLAAPGSYVDGVGLTASIQAPLGYYVADFGATSPTPAPPGSYVWETGTVAPILVPAGYFTDAPGQSSPKPAPPGSYVPVEGASAALLAPLGTYTDESGMTAPIPAPAGTYVPTFGATAAIPTPAGAFTDLPGQSVITLAPPGSYVATVGATEATLAEPGKYADGIGLSAPRTAQPGYFVAFSGATGPTPAAPGTYAPMAGATSALTNPPGTWSGTASPAVRTIDDTVARGGDIVGPVFTSTPASGGILSVDYDLNGGRFAIAIENLSNDLGYASELTDLQVVQVNFTGDGGDALAPGIALPLVFSEGQSGSLDFVVNGSAFRGPQTVTVEVVTDQHAAPGDAGDPFSYSLSFVAEIGWSQWLEGNFTPQEITDGIITQSDYDADGDGLSNLIEAVFDFDPRAPDSASMKQHLPRVVDDGVGAPQVHFSLPKGGVFETSLYLDLSLSLESNDWAPIAQTDAAGNWQGSALVESIENGNRIEYTITPSGLEGESRSFFRLRAILENP